MQNQKWLDNLYNLIQCWETDFEELDDLLTHESITSDHINLIHEMQDNIVACSHIAEKLHDCYAVKFSLGGRDFHVMDGDYHGWQ